MPTQPRPGRETGARGSRAAHQLGNRCGRAIGRALLNLARIVPQHVQVVLERGSWQVPGVFPWVQRLGWIEAEEMERVFNIGVGIVLVLSSDAAASV